MPRQGRDPVIVDQASSQVTKVALLARAASGQPLPEGWALDAEGRPTRDPALALKGSMLPAGGHKGAGIALLVEILAAGLTGANWSFRASSYGNDLGGPPRTGQFFLALAPELVTGGGFGERAEELWAAMLGQEGVSLPSDERWQARRRARREGVALAEGLHRRIARLIAGEGCDED